MPQGTMHGTLAGELIEVPNARTRTCCKKCGSERIYRLFREGYLQEKIYPILGFYPWRCKACKHSMMLRKRKNSRSSSKEYVE